MSDAVPPSAPRSTPAPAPALAMDLAAMLAVSADFVGVAAPDGTVEYLNEAGRRMLGLAPDADVSTLRAADYHPPATLALLQREGLPAALRDGRWAGEGALRGVGGRERPVSMVVVAHPSRTPDEPPRFPTVMRDIGERVAAEAALRAREAEHEALLAALPLIVYRVEPHAPYAPLYVSPGVSVLGYTLAEWLAAPDTWLRVLHPDDRARVVAETEAALAAGTAVDYEYRVLAKDGSVRWVHDRGDFVRDAAGAPVAWQGIMLDVTGRREAEAALAAREARLGLIYNSATDLIFLMRVERDAGGEPARFRCESVNEAYLAVTGLTPAQLIGRSVEEILPPPAAAGALERYRTAERTGDVQRYDETVDLPTGRLTVETTLTPVVDDAGRCTHLLGSARDVSATRRAEATVRESEARFRGVLENLRAAAVQLDATGRVTFANEALLALTGWTAAETIGADWFARFVPNGAAIRATFVDMLARRDLAPHYENEILARDGTRRLIAWDNVLLQDADGRVVGTASVGQDVTERRALEARLAALSEHDELTGLLNRRGFHRMAGHAMRSAARSRRRDAALYVDLDGFKPINDTHGHAAGDAALRAVAEVVRATIRDADFSARIGGDEFAIYAVGLREGEGHILAARLHANLEAHNTAAVGRPFRVRFSVGVAELEPGDELDGLLARADAALYAQKLARRM